MVGLSILLENLELAQKSSSSSSGSGNNKRSPQVINKITSRMNSINNKPTSPSSSFLDACFLCNQRLMPGRDIYMYKGDRAFCSEECRCRQMVMDDEEINASRRDHNCYFANYSMTNNNNKPTSSSSSSSSSRHHQRKPSESKNRGGHGLFAY